jgi:hypothetical protein
MSSITDFELNPFRMISVTVQMTSDPEDLAVFIGTSILKILYQILFSN